jgi:hypothetical protein
MADKVAVPQEVHMLFFADKVGASIVTNEMSAFTMF